MATVVKDFKVKAGLIVEGTTAKVNNFDILTKSTADQNYIIGLIGGSATAAATPDTVVLRDANGSFAANVVTADLSGNVTGNVTGDLTGNADTASTLETARTIALGGDVTGSVSFDGSQNVTITATVDSSFATDAEVATAKSEAISDSKDYTDGRETAITTAYQSYADQAEADAKSYTDGRETAITTAYQTYADTAEADAKSYTDSLVGDVTVDGTAGNTVTDRIASAVSNLVDTAPEALDTLNELAAALGDDPNFATTVSSEIGTKVSKAGDTMTGALTLSGAPTVDLHAATKKYVDDEITSANSAATTAVSNHSDLTTGVHGVTGNVVGTTDTQTLTNKTIDGSSNTVSNIANASLVNDSVTVNGSTIALGASATLDTDAIGEGTTNQYFTDERAQDAVAAAIAAGTHENIVITYDDNANSISFVAENGVADSTTTDLTEGTNLYFTDARAVSALEAVVPNFTEVDLNDLATQVAATATVETASQAIAYTFDGAVYRSAKFLVKVAYGTHTEVSEVLLTLDTSDNIAITEYAVVGTNGSASTISAGMDNTDVQLLVTTTNNNSTITVMGTLLK